MTPYRRLKFLRLWAGITVLAILCITALESFAIARGVESAALPVSIALIAGLAGAGLGRLLR